MKVYIIVYALISGSVAVTFISLFVVVVCILVTMVTVAIIVVMMYRRRHDTSPNNSEQVYSALIPGLMHV